MIRRVGKCVEVSVTTFTELEFWYDDQCKYKMREVRLATKEYKNRDNEERRVDIRIV
jgi:hypothetical protein